VKKPEGVQPGRGAADFDLRPTERTREVGERGLAVPDGEQDAKLADGQPAAFCQLERLIESRRGCPLRRRVGAVIAHEA
jgi:hypothetical protein